MKREFEELDLSSLIKRPYTLYFPKDLVESSFTGDLYGYFHPDTKTAFVLDPQCAASHSDARCLGILVSGPSEEMPDPKKYQFVAKRKGTKIEILIPAEPEVNVRLLYWNKDEMFGRNKVFDGRDFHEILSEAGVVLIGCGSGGGAIAVDLARNGIHHFLLYDDQWIEPGNVCRHECTVNQIGMYKTDAVKELILGHNPYAEVQTVHAVFEEGSSEVLETFLKAHPNSILVCAADGRHPAYYPSALVKKYSIPFCTAGCLARASTGELFFQRPNESDKTYEQAFGPDTGVNLEGQRERRQFYVTEEEARKMNFQPGLYIDIRNTELKQVQLILDLLLEDAAGYVPLIKNEIRQMTFIKNRTVAPEINPFMDIFTNHRTMRSFDITVQEA